MGFGLEVRKGEDPSRSTTMATLDAKLMVMPNEVMEKIMKHLLEIDRGAVTFLSLRSVNRRLRDLVDVMVRIDENVAKAVIVGAVPKYAAVTLWEEWPRQGWGHDNCKRLVEFLAINSPTSRENRFVLHKFRYSFDKIVETLTPFSKISVARASGNLMLVGFVDGTLLISLRDPQAKQFVVYNNQDSKQAFPTAVKDIVQTSVDPSHENLDLKVFFAISEGGLRMYSLSNTGREQEVITSRELRMEDLRSASACNGIIVVFAPSGIFIWDQISEPKVFRNGSDVLVTGYAFWNVRTKRLCVSTLSIDAFNYVKLSVFHLSENEERLVPVACATIGFDKTNLETSRLVKFLCDQVIGVVSADGRLVIGSPSFPSKSYNTIVSLEGVVTAIVIRFNVLFLGTSVGKVYAYKLRSFTDMGDLQLKEFDWSSRSESCSAVTSIDFYFCDEEATVIFSTSEDVFVCDWHFH